MILKRHFRLLRAGGVVKTILLMGIKTTEIEESALRTIPGRGAQFALLGHGKNAASTLAEEQSVAICHGDEFVVGVDRVDVFFGNEPMFDEGCGRYVLALQLIQC